MTSRLPEHALRRLDAVRSVLGDLSVPVVLDVDCGHVPPHLALIDGALAEVSVDVDGAQQPITQTSLAARPS